MHYSHIYVYIYIHVWGVYATFPVFTGQKWISRPPCHKTNHTPQGDDLKNHGSTLGNGELSHTVATLACITLCFCQTLVFQMLQEMWNVSVESILCETIHWNSSFGFPSATIVCTQSITTTVLAVPQTGKREEWVRAIEPRRYGPHGVRGEQLAYTGYPTTSTPNSQRFLICQTKTHTSTPHVHQRSWIVVPILSLKRQPLGTFIAEKQILLDVQPPDRPTVYARRRLPWGKMFEGCIYEAQPGSWSDECDKMW